MNIPLFDDYALEPAADRAAFMEFCRQHNEAVFGRSPVLPVSDVLSDAEQEHIRRLDGNMGSLFRLEFYVTKAGEPIGWTRGAQKDRETYSMSNTGIFPDYRCRGVYSALLSAVLDLTRREGFQKVISRHSVVNNAILVPKLKAGFRITGFEVNDVFGILVNLTYFFNERRSNALLYRAGYVLPDAHLAQLLGLDDIAQRETRE